MDDGVGAGRPPERGGGPASGIDRSDSDAGVPVGIRGALFARQTGCGGGIAMLPNQLAAESFSGYPAEAKLLATKQLALLRRLPLGFVPLLLRELIVYDWRF